MTMNKLDGRSEKTMESGYFISGEAGYSTNKGWSRSMGCASSETNSLD